MSTASRPTALAALVARCRRQQRNLRLFIAAVVVGGVAISGGRGNLWGVFCGLLLLACITPALVYLGIPPYWGKAIQGAIILLAVVADGLRTRKTTA